MRAIIIFLIATGILRAEEVEPAATPQVNKHHIIYLMQGKDRTKAIERYREYKKQQGKHDFEVLGMLGTILLEEGVRSDDPESQLISLFGAAIGGYSSSLSVLENSVLSKQAEVQLAAIRLLGSMQDDRSDELLTKAMSSEFFGVRLEAAYHLALRKSRSACGQIEGLMYRVPLELRALFPQFFALIGTSDAISVLKHLIDDARTEVRTEALLAAARYGRDDLLPLVRKHSSHLNIAEQETCASALGLLRDSHSLSRLKTLSLSPSSNVQLASLYSLYLLGEGSAKTKIEEMALAKNLFAIAVLGEISGSEETLAELSKDDDIQVRFNAAIALLQQRDGRSAPLILDILLRDARGLSLIPQFSLGKSLMAWKVISSAQQQPMLAGYDLEALSLAVREHLLRLCVDLPEKKFLTIAHNLFQSRQTELLPLLISLLENVQSPDAIALLQRMSQTTGAPLMRTYSSLALFRMNVAGPYEKQLREFLSSKKHAELIRFRPLLPREQQLKNTTFELTPEESSRLLIEIYSAFTQRHDEQSIDTLLEAIESGHPKNRFALAGLLIRSIE